MTYLKSDRHMESGDPKEVEIRGCSIEATERIVKRVNELSVPINSIQVDNFLWGFRRRLNLCRIIHNLQLQKFCSLLQASEYSLSTFTKVLTHVLTIKDAKV